MDSPPDPNATGAAAPPPPAGHRTLHPHGAAAEDARSARSGRLPGLRDPATLALLGLVLLLQLDALGRVEGYQLADSVEYMERAHLFVDGEPLDPGTVRSFAFSALFVPAFALARVLGLEGFGLAVALCRAIAIGFGLLAVLVAARAGARAFDRGTGLAAGLVVGASPAFLQWTVEPLSGSAAMLASALALSALLSGGGARRGLAVGLWLGAGILAAFQTILVTAPLLALLVLRDRWHSRASWLAASAGVAVMIVLQCLLDLAVYGAFGSSLWAYFVENAGGTVASWLYEAGRVTGVQALDDAARKVYAAAFDTVDRGGITRAHDMSGRTWYFENLASGLLAPPVLALLALGTLRAVLRPRWALWIPLATVLLAVAALTVKGSKSFRLWLPLLPMIGIVAGAGFGWLRGTPPGAPARRVLAALLLVLAAAGGVRILHETNLAPFGGYWRAIEIVNAGIEAEAQDADDPPRVAAANHWAVSFRLAPGAEVVKLPHPLYLWPRLDDGERAEVLERIESLDWFVAHQQILTQDAVILDVVNRRFEVERIVHDAEHAGDLLPIHVLRRRTGQPGARIYFEVLDGVDPAAHRAAVQHPVSVDFRGPGGDGAVRQMVLLGYDVDLELAEGPVVWLTTHWYAGPTADHDYTVSYRFTVPGRGNVQVNQPACYGAFPTSRWREGDVVRESLAITPPAKWPDFGGAWLRGDLVPVQLWVAVVEYVADEDGVARKAGELVPHLPSGRAPLRSAPEEGSRGRVFSPDGLVLAGGFWLPVPPEARIPDDGLHLRAQRAGRGR